jgi:LytS/YehU family sensor histidine kinase
MKPTASQKKLGFAMETLMKKTTLVMLIALSPSLLLAAPSNLPLTKCSIQATTHIEKKKFLGKAESSPSKTEILYTTSTLQLWNRIEPGQPFYMAVNVENKFTAVAEIFMKSMGTATFSVSIADASDLISYEGTNSPHLENQSELISGDVPLSLKRIKIGSSTDQTVRVPGGKKRYEGISVVCETNATDASNPRE